MLLHFICKSYSIDLNMREMPTYMPHPVFVWATYIIQNSDILPSKARNISISILVKGICKDNFKTIVNYSIFNISFIFKFFLCNNKVSEISSSISRLYHYFRDRKNLVSSIIEGMRKQMYHVCRVIYMPTLSTHSCHDP